MRVDRPADLREIALIAFDVDGTLVEHPDGKVIWELCNTRFTGTDEVNLQRYHDYKTGRIDYPTWVKLDVNDWIAAGATREDIREEVRRLRPIRGALESLRALRNRGYRLAVISGTLDVVIDEFFPDHPFEQVFTNRLIFDESGVLRGWEATPTTWTARRGRCGSWRSSIAFPSPGAPSSETI